MIGKDIVRFHAVYWPAFLMSAKLPLPRSVYGHGFITNRGEKMSKAVGNVLNPMDIVERHGVDPLRYFLLREVSFGHDGSFSEEALVTRSNADLANGLGNLAQRSLSMISKSCGGAVPEGQADDADRALIALLDEVAREVAAAMSGLALHQALEAVWRGVLGGERLLLGGGTLGASQERSRTR